MNFLKILEDFAQNYPVLYACTVIVTALTVSAVADLIVKKILLRGLKQIFFRLVDSDEAGQSLVLQIASRLANILPVIVLYCIPAMFPEVNRHVKLVVQRLCIILLIVFLTKSVMLLLDLVNTFYQNRENAESRPIKGYLQLGKILLVVVAAILVISFILDKSPVLLLSGLGAVAAVLM
ncbi:MAG: mechanosensitive ion channel family protein, partial [Lentisphaeria bacterium]|nr:mechanosensitive ion channel family protein [Lentisphaeria bacterium]